MPNHRNPSTPVALRFSLILIASLSLLVLATCGKDSPTKPSPPQPPTPPPVQPVPTRITITPATVTLMAVGQASKLTASVLDQNGESITSANVLWSSSNAAVATVSPQGLVTAVMNGTTQITARAGNASASVTVTVAQSAVRITISPPSATLMAIGDTVQLTAAVLDQNGQPVEGAVVTWSSSDEAVATVSTQGLVTAVGNGAAQITARAGNVSTSIDVTVMQAPGSIVIEPEEATLMAIGDTVQLTATVLDQNGQPVEGAVVTWSSSDENVATVTGQGLVTAVMNGTAQITARAGNASASVTVTVAQSSVRITISPPSATLMAIGDTVQLTAAVLDQNGQPVEGAVVTWSSSDEAVATVSTQGLVTAVGNGAAQITARAGNVSTSIDVTVMQAPGSIVIEPEEATLMAIGDTVQLTATVLDQNGQPVEGAVVTWSSSDENVATVTRQGLVTAVMNGAAQINARAGSASTSIDVTVMQAAISIVIEPAEAALMAIGDTVQLSAAVLDQNGLPVDGAVVAWQSSDEAVATVSPQGLVTAVMNGTAQITAMSGNVSAGIEVTVMLIPENHPPEIVFEIMPLYLFKDGPSVELDVKDAFSDPDEDDLVYLAESDNIEVISVMILGSIVTFSPVSAGSTIVTITASDGKQNTEQNISVHVVDESDQISITDPNLRAILEDRLGKPPGSPIFKHEMETLKSLDARYVYNDRQYTTILSLEGIQFATELEELRITRQDVNLSVPLDITPLASLIKLRLLDLAAVNNVKNPSPLDLSPIAGLINLTQLDIGYNSTPDITPLTSLINLSWLNIASNHISDLSSLETLVNLAYLNGNANEISDLSPLVELIELREVHLGENKISDLSPLVANTGLGNGDVVDVRQNPLHAESISSHVPALMNKGIRVFFDEVVVFTDPQVFNDNLFILPIEGSLGTEELPIKRYAVRFYEYFNDEFDFLLFVPNRTQSTRAYFASVMNDVEGIGLPLRSNDGWGSMGKLQGVINFGAISITPIHEQGQSILRDGPTLHELMHRWANFIIPSSYGAHWGYSSANGILGGFDIANLEDHGNGRYTAGFFPGTNGAAANNKPYSPIELYLAGLVGPEEVPDIWVAEDGEVLLDEVGHIVRDENGYLVFTANRIETYTIDDIISKHGPRVPEVLQSQRNFRAAVILLVDKNHPATLEVLDILSRDVSWFSHQGVDEDDQVYNFYEATGSRGTITMNGLSQLRTVGILNVE